MGHRSALLLAVVLAVGCSHETRSLETFEPGPFAPDGGSPDGPRDPMLAFGQALFFDPELSGNRNISCGTCHVPFLTTAEGIPLSLGEGATELGQFRTRNDGAVIRRHALDLFHRVEMDVLFWDGRVERLPSGEVVGPVPTPPEVTRALELASIVPLLDRDEMLGQPGDVASDGRPNELAMISDEQPRVIWAAIVERLRQHPEYDTLFVRAFGLDPSQMSIGHVAIALSHFQEVLWGPRGETLDPLLEAETARGRALFEGDGGCTRCHSGDLFTDQRFHDIAVPQLGPELDLGRFEVTGVEPDRFAFRTPPLRNVGITPPYMHNGAFETLEDAVRHHIDPVRSLRSYTGAHLSPTLRATLRNDPATLDAIEANLDPATAPLRTLSEDEVRFIVTFLRSLSNPQEMTRHPEDALPVSVPSGLPVDRWNGTRHPFR
ncbi:cytochrome-c peroxidase [Sandaracinus amylolyticus]|uniref:Cytochrome c551 peroxidase n=1 Tax=Sandaracinus amylolyticus TaxID=927083 RepID=A0A0F6WAB3_9BACT|nr:cytochrome c peroxidase [Sandaracinus amylolyticus]AKF11462.1 Cytochrome c551 peroxidase [Sandaracinus amylolyticus]